MLSFDWLKIHTMSYSFGWWVIKWVMSCCVMFESGFSLVNNEWMKHFSAFDEERERCLKKNFRKKKEKLLKPYLKPMSILQKLQERSDIFGATYTIFKPFQVTFYQLRTLNTHLNVNCFGNQIMVYSWWPIIFEHW